jgi:hypothetical protein
LPSTTCENPATERFSTKRPFVSDRSDGHRQVK